MNAGILVKHSPKVEVDDWLSDRGVTHNTIGLIREADVERLKKDPDRPFSELIWVEWYGQPDWDLMFPEDLVVFSS